jgi:hypothetical protein
MKNLSVEKKSTLKWILIWFVVCLLSWVIVFAAELNFSSYNAEKHGMMLNSSMWNWVLWMLDAMKTDILNDVKDYMVPSWTIIIFDWNTCPSDKWEKWTWYWERFLVPLQWWDTNWALWWSWEIAIGVENIPNHFHYVVWWNWTDWLSSANALSRSNHISTNIWDDDYTLAWSAWGALYWKTSSVGSWKAIKYMPPYVKVLFCRKK